MNFKKTISIAIEYIRPIGIAAAVFFAELFGKTPVESFMIMAPVLIAVMSGTIGLEGLFFGSEGSAKLGYTRSPEYQRQNALVQLGMAISAVLVPVLDWGIYGMCGVSSVFMFFLFFSGTNHGFSAIAEGNKSITNLSRPILSYLLIAAILYYMLEALNYQAGL